MFFFFVVCDGWTRIKLVVGSTNWYNSRVWIYFENAQILRFMHRTEYNGDVLGPDTAPGEPCMRLIDCACKRGWMDQDGWMFFFFFLPSHLFPVYEGRLATPGILPEQLNRGNITRFLSLRPPIPILVRYY